jgi:tRNA (guanine26-N2/guanine27-N2)-dimethyltransferase
VLQREGAVEFRSTESFFRPHSKVIRDLGVLALRVHGTDRVGAREISVLDAMCGSGVRTLRYIVEGGATHVVANDANDDLEHERVSNLRHHVAQGSASLSTGDAVDAYFSAKLEKRYYDMVDADGFGSGSPHSAEAWFALRIGGLLYLCSTDARTAAGKNSAAAAWRGFAATAQAMPSSNELGVRLLVADAVRQAAARGFSASPVFGLFHRQSSCCRVLMRLTAAGRKSCPPSFDEDIGFAAHCIETGEHWVVPLNQSHDPRAAAGCPSAAQHESLAAAGLPSAVAAAQLRLTGPIWTGNLHNYTFVSKMSAMAAAERDMSEAAKVLRTMADEVEHKLPPMYLRLKDIGKFLAACHGVPQLPRKADLVAELRRMGHVAGDAQAEAQAIKTSASMADVLVAATALVGRQR